MTEEASPLVGGLMAHDGHLKLAAVGAWITAGTWIADILLYYLGRWRGDWLRENGYQLVFNQAKVYVYHRGPASITQSHDTESEQENRNSG